MDSPNPPAAVQLEYAGMDVYRDRLAGWRRRFTLSGDRLLVNARRPLRTVSEMPISLHGVDAVFAHTRSRNVGAASLSMLAFVATFAVIAANLAAEGRNVPKVQLAIVVAFGILCIVAAIRSLRQVEYVTFTHANGRQFSIARNGPDREKFEAFVARVVERIQSLRS